MEVVEKYNEFANLNIWKERLVSVVDKEIAQYDEAWKPRLPQRWR
jgi:hypothetical protein